MSLLRTTDELRRYFAEFYASYGITSQQYNVLRILRGAGGASGGGLATMEIAERMVEKTPGITRLIDRLEEKGLIERELDPLDRRQRRVVIRRSGRTLLEELDEPVKRVTEAAVELLNAGEVAELGDLLERIRRRVAAVAALNENAQGGEDAT